METPSMPDIQSEYAIPDELQAFVDRGVLTVVWEKPEEKTVTFDIPKLRSTDPKGRQTIYNIDWIHPDFNAQFCQYYLETPGDLANFIVERETEDSGSELIDLNDFDDLISWLSDLEG